MRPSTIILLTVIFGIFTACEMHSADELASASPTPPPISSPTVTPLVDRQGQHDGSKPKVRKSPIDEKLVELVGLILVLGSTFWRLFLAERVKEIAAGVDRCRLEDKIDAIFWATCMHYIKDHRDATKRLSIYSPLDNGIDTFLKPKEEHAAKQSDSFATVANWAFVIGSALVIVPKLLAIIYGGPSGTEPINPFELVP